MADYFSVESAIIAYAKAQFSTALPGVSVYYQNAIDPASEDFDDALAPDEWIRVSIQHAGSIARTLNQRHTQNTGIVNFQIFTQLREGVGRDRTIARTIVDLFQRKQVGEVEFREVDSPPVLTGSSAPYYSGLVVAAFRFQNTPA